MRTHPFTRGGPALLLTLLVLLAACGDRADSYDAPEGDAPAAMTDADAMTNALTPEEEAEGWQLLFDGESLDGWRGFKRSDVPAGWTVDDGAIHFTGEAPEGEGGDIITEDQYDSFELALEWKVAEAGNSGIFYHVDEDHDYPWESGPEMQVLDNAGHPDAANGPTRQAGANYDMHAPARDASNPAGEWNAVRIVVDGPHVEHWMNGEKILEFEQWSDAWKEQVQNSKWKDYPDYGLNETGHIGLQDHGDPVWFRNIKIRPIAATGDTSP